MYGSVIVIQLKAGEGAAKLQPSATQCRLVLPDIAQTREKRINTKGCTMFISENKMHKGVDYYRRYTVLYVPINDKCTFRKRIFA